MPRRPCRSHEAAPPPPVSVHCPHDALAVAKILSDRFGPCLAAVCLDDWGQLVDVIAVDAEPDDLERLADDLLAIAIGTGVGALVLLTLGAPDVALACEDDTARWQRIRARYDAAGVDLLDWFLVADEQARSMAATAGSEPRW